MFCIKFALTAGCILAIDGFIPVSAQVPANYAGTPYPDTIPAIPGRLHFERFDQGAKNVAWYDSSSGNSGDYTARNPADVDLMHFAAMDRIAPGGTATLNLSDIYLRSTNIGDWLKFTVNVKQAGTYTLNAQLGVQGPLPSKMRLDILQGADSTAFGNITLPNSGCNPAQTECYHNWDYVRVIAQVPLRAGLQVLRFQVVTGGFNIGYLDFVKPDSAAPTYRVDCGGPAFTDSRGRAWEADAHFTGGGTISYPGTIKGTDMQALYQSERYNDPAKTPMKYNFTVPNGEYFVRLLFAETYSGFNKAGFRVFDVTLNGTPVLTSFDISALVGVDSALVKEFPIRVAAGMIEIGFINRIEHAKISGIEIIPGATTALGGLRHAYGEGAHQPDKGPGAMGYRILPPTWSAGASPIEPSVVIRDMRGRKASQAALPPYNAIMILDD